ncbi:MAG TPA: hypothetical protein VFU15_04365 [Bacteroidia bacterium]|nr:hypothetical protein [Bacteroidia bacterium]
MKNILFAAVIAVLPACLAAQDTPVLTDTDLGKTPGWAKIELDSSFQKTTNGGVYEFYDLLNSKGKSNCIYYGKWVFPQDAAKVIYTKTDPSSSSKLADGTAVFYDAAGLRIAKYVMKGGFILLEYNYRWKKSKKERNGSLHFSLQFKPAKDSVEVIYNVVERGDLVMGFHASYNGNKWKTIPGPIGFVPEDENFIGGVWQPYEYSAYQYDMHIDATAHNGKNAATIRSLVPKPGGSGGLVQIIRADQYLGKRVRMTAWMKSENVSNFAGLWLRVDQAAPEGKNIVCFDNMRDRPVKGTTGWTKYEIVFDVPPGATDIVFGAMLQGGTGQIWFDDFSFEVVDNSVPLTTETDITPARPLSSSPANLDFEK